MQDIENTNEWLGQKFITGHADATEKNAAKAKIESDIESAIAKMKANPQKYAGNADDLKPVLLKSAKENNWRGNISIRRSPKNDKLYITYIAGKTSLQHAGSAFTPDSKFGGY
jgi:hypothetical protein